MAMVWEVVACMLAEQPARQDLPARQAALLRGARGHLEAGHAAYMHATIQSNRHLVGFLASCLSSFHYRPCGSHACRPSAVRWMLCLKLLTLVVAGMPGTQPCGLYPRDHAKTTW